MELPPIVRDPDPSSARRREPVPATVVGVLAAVPASLLAVSAAEVLGAPWHVVSAPFSRLFGLLALSAKAAPQLLWPVALYPVVVALAVGLGRAGTARRVPARLVLTVASVLVVLFAYRVLLRDDSLAAYRPFRVVLVALALAQTAWAQLIFPWDAGRTARRWLGGARLVTAAAMAGGFVALHLINHRWFQGLYPTLHAAALVVQYLLAHAALSAGWLAAPPMRTARRLAGIGVVATVAVVATTAAAKLPSARALVPHLMRYTYVGDAAASVAQDDRWFDRIPVAPVPVAEDPAGLDRFDRSSGMPPWPIGFPAGQLNILLISVEAWRFDSTTMAAPSQDPTPGVWGAVSRGAYWFTRAYSAAPVTYQSMSSIFTMTIPSAAGLSLGNKLWRGELGTGLPTVPELLAREGYHTFWTGHDLRLDGCGRGFETQVRIPTIPELPTVDEQIRQAAEAELEKARALGRPFLGWVFFASPHEPYLAHYEDMPARTRKDRYLQEVRYADEQLGLLLEHLDRTGLAERTVVIIHSDHGEEFGEHGGEFHTNVYDECVHVPLVIRIPGVQGSRQDAPTSLTYVFPWLLRAWGGAAGQAAQQRIVEDLAPLMARTDGAVVSERLWEGRMRSRLTWAEEATVFDFRSGLEETYGLTTDPFEQQDLMERDPQAAERSTRRLRGYLEVRQARGRLSYWE